MAKNRLGLTRDIPSAIRKRVRRRCGFGCVICGNAIVTYEHFDPPFRDAPTHRSEGITLLCGGHQLESSKGLLSRASIAKANADPCCQRRGYASHVLDLGNQRPILVVGGSDVTHCGSGLAVNGRWMLRVREPEAHSHRWRLSARFLSTDGTTMCEIRNNELVVPANGFEIEQTSTVLSIRRERNVLLELELTPPAMLSVNRYIMTLPEGELFIGRRRGADPLTSLESLKSVIEFQQSSGGKQTFVNCGFRADLGLNFSLSANGLIMQNQVV